MNQMTTPAQVGMPALPAHLQTAVTGPRASSIGAGVGSTYQAPPRLSIEGGKFRMIKGDQNFPITVPDGRGNMVAVPSLDMVIVEGNPGRHKTYFASKYTPGGQTERPICYSYDGITPSIYADAQQSPSCQTCQWNRIGSMVNDQGNETKACSDSKLLAVIPLHAIQGQLAPDAPGGEAYQMKVSATALSRSKEDRKNDPANNTSLSEYLALLNRYPTGPNAAVAVDAYNALTSFFFDLNAQYPLLRFRLSRFLAPEEIAYITARRLPDAEGRSTAADILAIVSDPGLAFGVPPAATLAAHGATQSLPPPNYTAAPLAAPAPVAPVAPAAAPYAPPVMPPAAIATPAAPAQPAQGQFPGQETAPATRPRRGRPPAAPATAYAAPVAPAAPAAAYNPAALPAGPAIPTFGMPPATPAAAAPPPMTTAAPAAASPAVESAMAAAIAMFGQR